MASVLGRIHWIILVLCWMIVLSSCGDIRDLLFRCPDGTFGYKCQFRCHCRNGDTCNKETGWCRSGCANGFWGPGCQLTQGCFYNGQKKAYMGTVSVTQSGYKCQRWSSQVPHRHTYKPADFPDDAFPENYCRTTHDAHKPWCYTTTPGKRWEYCNVINCDCPAGRFGANCAKECHCSSSFETCGSIMGMCRGRCGDGWRDFGCQTATSCARNRYGWDCALRCHCENSSDCDRFSGPSSSCECERGYFNPPKCEPVTAPKIIELSNSKVNPGQPTVFNCTVAAYPTPLSNEIVLKTPRGKSIRLIRSDILHEYSFTRVSLFQVNKVIPHEMYSCEVRGTAGATSRASRASTYTLPKLVNPPSILSNGIQTTNISMAWEPWNPKVDVGDPPVIWYSVFTKSPKDRKAKLAGIVYNTFCGKKCTYVLKDLQPHTMYAIHIVCRREGEGGDGPPGPTINARTLCAAPTQPVEIQGLTSNIFYNYSTPRSTLTVKWKNPPKDSLNCKEIVRYFVYLSNSRLGTPPRLTQLPGGSPTRVTLSNLEPFTWYCVRIRYQTDGRFPSPQSKENCAQTPEATPLPPINLALQRTGSESMTLSWEQPTPLRGNITHYRIVYSDSSNKKQEKTLTAIGTHMQYILTRLQSFTEYKIQVQAINSAGAGDLSEAIIAKTLQGVPGPVRSLRNVTRTSNAIRLMWSAPEKTNGQLEYYQISCRPVNAVALGPRRQTSEESSTVEEKVPAVIMDVTMYALNPATQYGCGVKAISNTGAGPERTILVWTEGTEPYPPESPKVLVTRDNTVTVDLQSPEDQFVSFYRIIVERHSGSEKRRRQARETPTSMTEVNEDFFTAVRRGSKLYVAAQLQGQDVNGPFTVGDNGTYGGYYNAPLQQEREYTIWFGAYSTVDGALTQSFSKTDRPVVVRSILEPKRSSSHIGIIVGVLAVFILLVLTFAVFLLIWKKRSNGPPAEKQEVRTFISFSPPPMMPELDLSPPTTPLENRENMEIEPLITPSTIDDCEFEPVYGNAMPSYPPVRVEDLWDYVRQQKENDMEGLKQEYKLLPAGLTAKCDVAKRCANKAKNRYGNIVAYDHTRVILTSLPGDISSDYINANYIDGYNKPRAYIAAQGPNKATLGDIWRMVWQENSKTIIMLTNPTETGRRKCDQYWPDEGCEQYGDITVQFSDCDKLPDFTIRTFLLTRGEESKIVKQFHYTTWPDHGVPKFGNSLILFRQKLRAYDPLESGPPIVHCSAGVGRTGTYIAIDTQLEKAKIEDVVDVHNFAQLMRTQRVNMVQTLEQYIFVYDVLLEALICGETTIPLAHFHKVYEDLYITDAVIGKPRIEEQFEILRLISATLEKEESTVALQEENVFKNRFKNIIPANRCRPYLTTLADGCNDYINAVFANGFHKKDAFLITQMPLSNTVVDFWRLIYDMNCCTIVMMNEADTQDPSSAMYWTLDACGENYGPFIVETTAEIKSDPSITVRDFTITHTGNPGEVPRLVRQFHFHRWSEGRDIPSSKMALLDLLSMVEEWQQLNGNRPVTVHCMNGASRSGLYCAVSCVLERVRIDQEVDVFQAVKQLRINRSQLVESLEQYKFCYDIVQDYLNFIERTSSIA